MHYRYFDDGISQIPEEANKALKAKDFDIFMKLYNAEEKRISSEPWYRNPYGSLLPACAWDAKTKQTVCILEKETFMKITSFECEFQIGRCK